MSWATAENERIAETEMQIRRAITGTIKVKKNQKTGPEKIK
jgi:hypothetical protein